MYIKSPLRYPGGKSKAIDSIIPYIPEFKEYREPFIGGGSIYFYIRQKYGGVDNGKKYWINDIFWELYNFWKYSQSNLNGIVDNVRQWKDQYKNGKELFRFLKGNWYRFNDIEKASAFFTLNRITFAGGTLTTGYAEVQHDGFIRSAINELSDVGRLLSETRITNYDYQKVVEEPGDDVFIYLDPPYYSATSSGLYGKSNRFRNTHKMFDHYRFSRVMKDCKHKWLITYDDSPFVRKQFEWATIIPWELIYGMRTKNTNIGKELFITNMAIADKMTTVKTKQFTLEDSWG